MKTFIGGRDYTVGSIIEYGDFLGGTRRVHVVAYEANMKNGRSGFDGVLLEGVTILGTPDVWGYDDQIVRVIK